jgi:hypothetical protein
MLKRTAGFIVTGILIIAALSAMASGCGPASSPATTPASPSATATPPSGQEPVEIVSVTGPIPPYNPGGPVVEITLRNAGSEPVTSLTATLDTGTAKEFTFDVTPSSPLLTGESTSTKETMISSSFSYTVSYPLSISGTLQSGDTFSYTKQVLIKSPPD